MVKRVLSLVTWFVALAVLILTAAPAAIAQDDPPPPPDDGFGFPGGELPEWDGTYPPEWDPSKPDVVSVDYVVPGLVLNTATNSVYDPYYREVILEDGTVISHATGEVVDFVPAWFPPVDVNALPSQTPSEPAEPSEASGPPTAEPEPIDLVVTGGDVGISAFEDEDPVLSLYRTGFTAEQLAPFALDLDTLPIDALDDSFQFLAYEIALLFEMGAFTRETTWFDTFAELHAQFDFDDISRDRLVPTFTAVDLEFARRALLYRDGIDPVDGWSLDWAISELEGDFYEALGASERGFLSGYEYAAALLRVMAGGPDIELQANGAAENVQLEGALAAAVTELELQQDINDLLRADNDELRSLLAEFTEPSVSTALALLDGPPETAEPAGDNQAMTYAAVGGGAAVVVLPLAFLLLHRARRRAGRPDEATMLDEAMATNQLLAGAKNEDEIVSILERAGKRQVNASVALFHAAPDGLRRAGTTEIIVGSDLQRVVSSGQHAKTNLYDDPAFPGIDQAVLALPVIHGGMVQAVLAAHRDVSHPLGDAERDAMEPIAPALGGALERSAELGTMSKLAMVDGLTSLGNRRRLDGDLETTLATAVAGDAHLGFAMIDVDHFKTYNDTHGHTAGDDALRRVAAAIARSVRESDVVYRYGGEEFSMLLPGATPEEVATVAERVRSSVEAEAFPGEELQPGGKLTVSIGAATLETGDSDDIRERADQALYRAKANGRNQVAYA